MKNNKAEKLRVAVIGLGGRGRGLLSNLLNMPDVEIVAVADRNEDKLNLAMQAIAAKEAPAAGKYFNYQSLLQRTDIEAVVVATSIVSHARIAIDVMRSGKHVGIEVGGAASIEECWELVRTSEMTGMQCMTLSNCNYGRREMALLHMVKQELFGELIHCQCGYEHDLRPQIVMGLENKHNRFHLYANRNGDNYPTHGLGPLAKCLNINRGNRFLTLTSMSSKSRGLQLWAEKNLGADHMLAKKEFRQGDIINTMIKCAHGETITLTLDTSSPRPYSRAGRIQGTNGLWMEDNNSIHIEGTSPHHEWESFDAYQEKYDHPLWKQFLQLGIQSGHGGTDYLTLSAFVESIRDGVPAPIDVYDTATWMAVTVLSEESIALGSQPLSFPDFTSGQWINREEEAYNKYTLNRIDESKFVQ